MDHISRKAAATILHSARTADSIGRPLNQFVTLRLWQIGSTPHTIASDFSKIRQWFRRWSDREATRKRNIIHPRNGTATYIYVLESTGSLSTGEYPHAHWAVHIMGINQKRFMKALKTRLKQQFRVSGDLPCGVIHVRNVENAEGLKLYFVKSIDPVYAELWNINYKYGGYILGRRADASRNLGPMVWKPLKAEYKRKNNIKRSFQSYKPRNQEAIAY